MRNLIGVKTELTNQALTKRRSLHKEINLLITTIQIEFNEQFEIDSGANKI